MFLTGALVGFGVATIYSSAHTLRLYDEKRELTKELAEVRAQKLALEEVIKGGPSVQVEITDQTVGDKVDYSQTW